MNLKALALTLLALVAIFILFRVIIKLAIIIAFVSAGVIIYHAIKYALKNKKS